MYISDIKKDKKHLNKILLSSGDEILIDVDVCIEKGISVNDGIDEDFIKQLKDESEYKRAKSRALWYLDRMDYTENALYQKLIRAGFDKKACAKVVAWCVEFGLVDDRRYAERFALRCSESNISKREAIQKMYAKGISAELAKEVWDETETDEQSQLKALIEKKYANKLTAENGTQKVFSALIRKGFSYGAVKEAMKKYCEELEFYED